MTNKKLTVALVAHDHKKQDMLEWAKSKKKVLREYNLIGTAGTAAQLKNVLDLDVESFGHGPSGGDIYLAAKILDKEVDKVVFFIDVETPQGHEHDIQTLIRTAVINNIPIALNLETANHIIKEPLS
jgi:methylglyoxal synthase